MGASARQSKQTRFAHLVRVAEVHRVGKIGIHQGHQAGDQIAHVLKRPVPQRTIGQGKGQGRVHGVAPHAPGLIAGTVHRQGLVLKRLDDKVAHDTAIANVHARPKRVEDARDPHLQRRGAWATGRKSGERRSSRPGNRTHLDVLLLGVGVAHRLGNPLPFIVA
jgi:hypothetical protein